MEKLLSTKQLLERIPATRATIRSWERKGKFPQRIRLAANKVAWKESEVEAWMEGQKRGLAG